MGALLRAHPNAILLGGSEAASTAGDAEIDAGPTVIRGPAFARANGPLQNTWHFSENLSPERLQQLQGLVAMNSASLEADRDRAAADAAFAQMVDAHPGAREVAPGVFTVVEAEAGPPA